jgi:kelch-like protein 10
MIFAFGGWSGGNATSMLEAYDVRADKWTVISTDQGIYSLISYFYSIYSKVSPRAYHGCITVGDKMYVIGGFDGTECFNSCRTFHLIDRVWNEIAPMNERRCYISVAYLNGFLYAMGGFNGHVRQNSAEKYLFETNQWSAICPMHVQRSDASACTLNGKYTYMQ